MSFINTNSLVVYTDGSYKEESVYEFNAGWACVFHNGFEIELAYNYGDLEGSSAAELEAIIMALELTKTGRVTIKSDDQNLVNILKNYFEAPVLKDKEQNRLKKIKTLCINRDVSFEWVKGHHEDKSNIIADALASRARISPMRRLPILYKSNYR